MNPTFSKKYEDQLKEMNESGELERLYSDLLTPEDYNDKFDTYTLKIFEDIRELANNLISLNVPFDPKKVYEIGDSINYKIASLV